MLVFSCDFWLGVLVFGAERGVGAGREVRRGGFEEINRGKESKENNWRECLRRRSKKLVPAAWIAIRYWSFVGIGSGTSATLSSSGPYTLD